jgi:predicted RNA methylase
MILRLQETADILRISPATVRNWLKTGVLRSTSRAHVLEIQKKLKTGELQKLQTRANRGQSKSVHGHAELLKDASQVPVLKELMLQFAGRKNELLLAVFLVQLEELKLIKFSNRLVIASSRIKKELAAWGIEFNSRTFQNNINHIKSAGLRLNDNLLSYLHQSMSETSEKQRLGAYYTPAAVIADAVSRIQMPGEFCDPCCGSGNFLAAAYEHFQKSESSRSEKLVFGFDKDLMAVLIARANLTLASKARMDVLTAVQHRDFLKTPPSKKFAYVMTNPPWGAFASATELGHFQNQYSLKKSKDSFSFFLAAGLKNLKKNGTQVFVLPQSFMTVRMHQEIRRYLFSNYSVRRIEILNQKFSGVQSSSLLIEIENRRPQADHSFEIVSEKGCVVKNSEVLSAPGCFLPLGNDTLSIGILKELESASGKTLKGNSRWGLGLVTGNNEKYLAMVKRKGFVPVIKGSDLFRFRQPEPNYFLKQDFRRFQQTAPLEIYRSEKKLVYRFICKELVFTVDTQKYFTLNSANILIPGLTGYSCEFLCGLFNSKPAQYYFIKKFASVKVLRSQIENFPLPPLNAGLFSRVEKLALKLRDGYDASAASAIDELIMTAYGLTERAKSEIRKIPLSGAFSK